MLSQKHILPVIVISQFFCTSLWFAGNAVPADFLTTASGQSIAWVSIAVQLGFICGTLVFALTGIADRFRPTGVFLLCAILASFINLLSLLKPEFFGFLMIRFSTGFFLAGIYPVGMKIASDHFKEGLGRSLGYLVGALVLGTALPHLLRSLTETLSWQPVIYATSALSFAGGMLMFLLVPQGQHLSVGQPFSVKALFSNLKIPEFRAAAFGYFGHMWELYAFWAFVPVLLNVLSQSQQISSSFLSFLIIGIGAPACVIGGYVSRKFGSERSATAFLAMSGLCCLIAPLVFQINSISATLAFLLFWGMVVVADSPFFSTLVARSAAGHTRGSALTAVTCIGFSITLLSIQLLIWLVGRWDATLVVMILAVGPIFGVSSVIRKKSRV